MKVEIWLQWMIAFCSLLILCGCAVVGGIFKTGMGVGIFSVVSVLAFVLFFRAMSGKNKLATEEF